MSQEILDLVPAHRTYINYLINENTIDMYMVSMETGNIWITINADSKEEVTRLLSKSPLFSHWGVSISEIFIYDGQPYRIPALMLN